MRARWHGIALLAGLVLSVNACQSRLDCALNGECVGGVCVCDKGWQSQPGATPCSFLNLLPASPDHPGYRNRSWPSWGGHPIQGEDGKWHLFTPQFALHCSVDQWINNSFVIHAVGDTPVGPWEHHDVALTVFTHSPMAVRYVDGTYLLFFIGGWHYNVSSWSNCSSQGGQVWPPPPLAPGLPGTNDGCGPPPANSGCGIRIASSPSPYGPWEVHDLDVPEITHFLFCQKGNPSPYVLPNGTVVLAVNGGACHGGLETIGVLSAPHWRGPYRFTSSEAIADSSHCPTGQLAEDPFLWQDAQGGWHIIAHGLCDWHPPSHDLYSLHAYSLDAVTWHVSSNLSTGLPAVAYPKHVKWTNKSTTYIPRMERPQLVLDSDNHTPLYLTTAVCMGGNSVGTCHGSPSWGLYRPIA